MKRFLQIEPLHSIAASRPVDMQTIQIFDMISLLVKQDAQIRALSQYILEQSKQTFDVLRTDTELWLFDKRICTVQWQNNKVILTFDTLRPVISVAAVDIPQSQISIVGQVATITGIGSATQSITVSAY